MIFHNIIAMSIFILIIVYLTIAVFSCGILDYNCHFLSNTSKQHKFFLFTDFFLKIKFESNHNGRR